MARKRLLSTKQHGSGKHGARSRRVGLATSGVLPPYKPPTEPRRRIMSSIRSRKNKTTELALARLLRVEQLAGWRRHQTLPGRPDFVWRAKRVAVFVDGCFWHGCPRHYRPPQRNVAFWASKVASNRFRDREVTLLLRKSGWAVIRVWECQVGQARTLTRIRRALERAQS